MNMVEGKNAINLPRELQVTLNKNSMIEYITPNCKEAFGYEVYEILGTSLYDIVNHDNFKIICENPVNFEIKHIKKDGREIFFDIMIYPLVDSYNTVSGAKISFIDITKHKFIEKGKNTILKILENSKDIIYRLELQPKFKFTYISPGIEFNLGFTVEESYNNSSYIFQVIHPEDMKCFLSRIQGSTEYGKPVQCRVKHKNGYYVWIEDFAIPVYDEMKKLVALEGVIRNIEERKQLESKLKRMSYYDCLTGLFNKTYLKNQLEKLNREIDISMGIIVFDLDNLKQTNDKYGHTHGDLLLKSVAEVLSKNLSFDAIVSRIGGDEFVILVKNITCDELTKVYRTICIDIEEHNESNPSRKIEISIGYSFSATSIGMADKVFNIADKNMYLDKKSKKICTQ